MMFFQPKRSILVLILTACAVIFSFCQRTPAPSASINVKVTGNSAVFTVEATDAETFSWDFGDGSSGSSEKNPVHIFAQFGKEYPVSLTVTGPGGTIIATVTVRIPSMTKMEMLTGGVNDADGQAWKLSQDAEIFLAKPDAVLTVKKTYSKGILASWGFSSAYQDKYIFKNDGTFSIVPAGQGMPAGLMYCTSKNIPNTPPSQTAAEKGLTLMTSFHSTSGLSFAMNESRDLNLEVCSDDGGENVTNVTIPDVPTLNFSKEAFIGFKDWQNECIILDLTETSMKVAVFISTATAGSPLQGKITGAFILTMVHAE